MENSKHSERALDFASRLASSFGSELHLLNVVEELDVNPRMERQYVRSPRTGERMSFEHYLRELYHDMKDSASGILEEKRKEIAEKGILGSERIKTKALLGHPPDKILDYIKDERIDLVVMGTLGRKGISRVVGLGSVARKVSEDAPCPVILIH